MSPTFVTTRHGFRIQCELEDWLSQHVFVSGSYEENTASLFEALIRPGDTVVDVGANLGFFTLLFSSLVGETGAVIACEPMPLALERLRRHLALNEAKNVTLHAVAVSSTNGEARFYLGPPEHTSISSLNPREHAAEVIVSCRRLDDLLAGRHVDFIKIDVEGAEADVLEGAEETLRRGVRNIVAEVSSPAWPSRLLERGYRMYAIHWDALRPVLDPADPRLPTQYNALFTRDGALPASVRVDAAA
jgi:FkbM family methyltransferase